MSDFYEEYFNRIEAIQELDEADRLTIVLLLVGRLAEADPANEDLNLLRTEIEHLIEIYKEQVKLREAFAASHKLLKRP